MVVHRFVSFPSNAPEYGIESVVAERDKWNLDMQKHRVYSALVKTQGSYFQGLSDSSGYLSYSTDFWVFRTFPLKQLRSHLLGQLRFQLM